MKNLANDKNKGNIDVAIIKEATVIKCLKISPIYMMATKEKILNSNRQTKYKYDYFHKKFC